MIEEMALEGYTLEIIKMLKEKQQEVTMLICCAAGHENGCYLILSTALVFSAAQTSFPHHASSTATADQTGSPGINHAASVDPEPQAAPLGRAA